MSNTLAAGQGQVAGDQAMVRLADRLAAMTQPEPMELTNVHALSMPRTTPATAAALATSAKIAARAAERARRSRSIVGLMVDGFIAFCSAVPYAVVGLALRLVLARTFFLDGQTRIEGPRVPFTIPDWNFNFTTILPTQVKSDVIADFVTQVPPLPVSPVMAAHVLAYAEFVLPILLLLGFATRFAALGVLAITVLLELYVMPHALWTAHVYWAVLALVLVSRGAGGISIDAIIRYIARR